MIARLTVGRMYDNTANLSKASLRYEPIQQPESFLQFLECQIHLVPVLHHSCTAAAMPHGTAPGLSLYCLAPNHQLQHTERQVTALHSINNMHVWIIHHSITLHQFKSWHVWCGHKIELHSAHIDNTANSQRTYCTRYWMMKTVILWLFCFYHNNKMNYSTTKNKHLQVHT